MTDFAEFDPASLPDPYAIDWENLTTEDDFGRSSYELLKETVFTAKPLATFSNDTPRERNEAILVACVLRMSLLGRSLLSDIMHNDGYQQIQILRQAFEVVVNFLYLIEDDGSGERFDAFINEQLAEEKVSLDLIGRMVEERNGESWPIEERMRQSMERMASAADIDLKNVPGKKKSGWPSAFERFKALGPTAYLSFRTGSSAVHGNWTTLLIQDLEEVEGGFVLSGRGSPPDTRAMLALVFGIVLVASLFLDKFGGDAERALFQDRLGFIEERRHRLDELHEEWFQE